MKIKDCMSQNVCCVKPETKVTEIVKLMKDNHIGCVPVCDDNNCICGILTDRDILLRTVAYNKDINTTKASDIMTTNICTCKQDEDISNAENKMSVYQVRRLPICDDKNCVVGIVTLANLAENDMKLGKENVCDTLNNICDCNTHKNDQ